MKIKAITIQQPYASLIASGEKWVENRTWFTDYRGPLAIHAGRGTQYLSREELAAYPTGAIIAVANLLEIVSLQELRVMARIWPHESRLLGRLRTPAEVLAHAHTEGPVCWLLFNVRRLKTPVPAVGKQGLWNWEWER